MENFTFSTRIDVRISDINYGGHLGNDRYLAFFHEARIRYLKQLDLSEIDIGDGAGLIMTESHVNYKAEAFLGDVLDVGVRISEIKGSRFLMEYQLLRVSDQRIVGTGYTQLVAFNYAKRKIVPLPSSFSSRITGYERNLG
ncbi:acyl-CoA thioesterase [candidate division KSB1 bacterium]|nr:acyl-CoA thioesterase [candidate division KSB1 bacterium]